MKKEKKVYYYKTYEDDFVKTDNPNYTLPDDYIWIHNNLIYKISSIILYYIVYFLGRIYCKFFLHIKIENKEILKKYKKQGYFLYGNHTLPIGDVFIPTIISNNRIYVIGNSTNLKVKVIGPLLPMIGILPIPEKIIKIKDLINAVNTRIKENKTIVIYPEAHVWPYYTKIRPFKNTSFKYPVDLKTPVFCITTTYYKRKIGNKPGIKVYIDGPFLVNNQISNKENQEMLCQKVYNQMVERSKNNTYEYVEYKQIKE